MSSTIYNSESLAPVINISAARARLGDPGVGDTLMVRVSLVSDDAVYRWVGIHEHTRIDECRLVVATVFHIDGDVGCHVDGNPELREVLRSSGDTITFAWGLWQFDMQLADVYARDESTPPSVCVAGSGSFGDTPFDIRRVNAELLGVERIKELKSLVRDDARDVIGRASSHDFLPLIQALGVERTLQAAEGGSAGSGAPDGGASEAEALRARLAGLPVETDPRERDAFWASVLATACCAGDDLTCQLTESIMESLGYEDLDAAAIRDMCPQSLAELDEISADLALPERLDVYRDLLRVR